MKPELSEVSSSSSFFRQKEMISKKGVLNVDLKPTVNEMFKKVSLTIEKVNDSKNQSKKQADLIYVTE